MRPDIPLHTIKQAFEQDCEQQRSFVDLHFMDIVSVDTELLSALEDPTTDPSSLEEWPDAEVMLAKAIDDDLESKRYIAIPPRSEFHEYTHLEHFISSLNHPELNQLLQYQGHAAPSMHRLLEAVAATGHAEAWHSYRDSALTNHLLEWALFNSIAVSRH